MQDSTQSVATAIDATHERTGYRFYGMFADLDIRNLESCRSWLWANDSNGEWGDSDEFGALTLEAAHEAIVRMIEDL